MSFHSGIGGTVTVNGTELAITRWSVNAAAEVIQFRNSKTGKHPKKDTTFEDGDFQFSVDWDDEANIYATPLEIEAGAVLTNVRLYLHRSVLKNAPPDGPYWHFPSAIVARTPQTLDVAGRIETTVEATADGDFGTPGNPVVP